MNPFCPTLSPKIMEPPTPPLRRKRHPFSGNRSAQNAQKCPRSARLPAGPFDQSLPVHALRRSARHLAHGEFNRDLSASVQTERNRPPSGFTQREHAGGVVALGDAHDCARREPVLVGKAEEIFGLISDLHDSLGGAHHAGAQCRIYLDPELPFPAWYRVAVGVGLRMTQEFVEAIEDLVGDRVFESLGLAMDGGPVHFKNIDEKRLHEAVFAENIERETAPGGGEADAMVGKMPEEGCLGERFDHRRGSSRGDRERGGERAHGNKLWFAGR